MGLINAISSSFKSTLKVQWKNIITADSFDDHTLVSPGIYKNKNNESDENIQAKENIITNGSKIYVPENTAAFIFNKSGIVNIITEPGGFEYQDGEKSIFNKDSLGSVLKSAIRRVGFGGITDNETRICYVNLREIRNIGFGTIGPIIYHDNMYGIDLDVRSCGSYCIKIIDPEKFVCNYLPANQTYYTMDDMLASSQLRREFIQAFVNVINSYSGNFPISQLASQSNEIAKKILEEENATSKWEERFGIKLTSVAVSNIELSDESKQLVSKYNDTKIQWKAVEEVSKKTGDIMAQQHIAKGIEKNGLGDAAGMALGLNMVQSLNPQTVSSNVSTDLEKQLDLLNKLKDALNSGILTQKEFDEKKKEILGL